MNIRQLFRRSTQGALWYFSLVVALPVISLSVLGLVYLWQHDYILIVLVTWLTITLAAYATFALRTPAHQATKSADKAVAENSGNHQPEGLPEQLNKRADWTEHDNAAWDDALLTIKATLDKQPAWETLPEHALQLLAGISAHYHPSSHKRNASGSTIEALEYHFTLPEALLVVSVASDRYRRVVLGHVPFAERITVSTLKKMYSRQADIKSGLTWVNRARRVVRLVNPVGAVIGELKDQFTDRVFNHLSLNVQTELKSLLLQEVAQVGIDLYSGKLKSSSEELQQYQSGAYLQDAQHPPESIEPLRILLLGQTSSGKSSMVNALADTLKAEVDTLPTTDRLQTHAIQLAGTAPMHMIDTVGLDGSPDSIGALTALASNADMIVYLARATQPARGPDQQLYDALTLAFAGRPDRRLPPLLLALTHVDLLPPRNQWSPPYDLAGKERKSTTIRSALTSTIEQIGLPTDTPAVPVCLSPDKGYYNIDAVAAALMSLQSSATLAQWNRRRVERGEQSISWGERWMQVKRLGQVIGKATLR